MATSTASTTRMNPHFPTTREGASSGAELYTLDGRTLPLVASTLRAEAQGGIARLVLEQAYVNSYAETLAVTYRMPLPAEGAVSGYAFEIAGRVVRGVVDRKQQARERFEQAIASGKTAALLEQERSDIFTQRIGNIPAGETIIARITIDQRLVWLPEGEWELRFPTVIGSRYCGTAETMNDARATHVKVAPQDVGVRLQIELAIKDAISGGRKAASPSHQLAPKPDGTIALSTGTRLDRDLVVRWPVASPAVGASLAVARPGETAEAFGLMTIVPPAKTAGVKPVPRDLLVLLDTSGSMGGGPLEKAKQVVAMLIDSLGEADRLELIEFSNNPRRYKDEPVMATAKAKADAIKWVRSRTADGGTEMRQAVIEALQTLRIGAQRQVVVVTDGYVGGEQQILRVLHEKLPASCRLHVLGVGSAVNRSLATALARAGRGAEVIVGIDEDAERGAKRLFDRTRMPVLTNVEIFGSALVRAVPEHIPDVFEGSPLLAALELRPEGGELTVRGQLAYEAWEQTVKVPATRVGDGNPALAALFGRERVADLEARSTLETVNAEIEALGLRFQIATRLTSWVAVDETMTITPGPSRHEVVPQEVPYGTSAAAFGLRGSAPMMAQEQFAVAHSMKTMAVMVGGAYEDDSDEEIAAPRSMAMTRAGVVKGGMPMGAGAGAPPSPRDQDEDFGEAAPSELIGESEPTGVSTRTGGYAPPAPSAPRMQAPAPAQPAQPKAEAAGKLVPRAFRVSAGVAAPEPKKPMAPKESRARMWALLLLLAGLIAAFLYGLLR
ncbi:MAG: VWA domain-containing protein [Deltaproteobacteria bacterium]|nr:VWA domain-containing protein [Deltaproteobacteria bacterium]